MVSHAVPVEESIPEGIEGYGNEPVHPADDQSFLLKIKLLKKLFLLG
ncbi:maker641 [Drosophila busckii]|uniref:Maker641 n=2 Tax=Drosophila busckii TaxID=30019 RepID=A0A0M5J0M6_DROBS|nr:maker641 [Drosophila busckii]